MTCVREASSAHGETNTAQLRPRSGLLSPLVWMALLLAAACTHAPEPVAEDPVDEDLEAELDEDYEWPATPPIPAAVEPVRDSTQDPSIEGIAEEPVDEKPSETAPPVKEISPEAKASFETAVGSAKEGDWVSARQGFEEAVRLEPELKWGWYNLGVVRDRAGDELGAMDAWRRALDADSSFTPAAVNIARLRVRQGRAREAERMLRERIQLHPEDLELRNELARVMIAQGTTTKLDAAFAEAREVLSSDEQNVGALLVLGQVFYRQDKHELAEWVVDRVLALEPANPAAHHLMGFLHIRNGQRRDAFASFQRAARSGGEYAEMYVNYGAFLNQAQDFDSAAEQLELAVRFAPRMVAARLNLGNAYRGLGRYKEALSEYELVRQLDPQNADALLNMALIFLDANLEEVETLARLEKARELFAAYTAAGGTDDRIPDFLRDAGRAIDVEQRRLERDSIRRAQEAEKAQLEAEEEAARRAEDEAAQRVEEERALREADEAAARSRQEEEERVRREEAEERARREADEQQRVEEAERARREAEEAFRARRAAEEEARRAEVEDATRRAAEAAGTAPSEGRRLGDDDEEDEEEDEDEAGTRLGEESRQETEEDEAQGGGTLLGGDDS